MHSPRYRHSEVGRYRRQEKARRCRREKEHLRPREKKRSGAGVLVLNKIRDVEKSFLKTVSSEKTRSCSIIYP